MRILRHSVLVAFVALLLLTVASASAHGYIVRAIPEDRAVLDRPPTRLQYWFSEGLEPEFSTLRLRDQNGDIIAEGGVSPDDAALLTMRVPADLPEGAYIVELRPAFASDGHVIAESRVFFIGAEVGGIAGQGATDQAVPLEVVWKTITLIGTLLLFGVFTLYAMVLVPAWGSKSYRAGLLPPRVMNRLNIIAGITLFVTFTGNALALIQQTMVFFNIGFSQALNPDFWGLVRIGSRFGDIWNFRIGFLILTVLLFGASLYFRKNQPETVRPFWVANAWGAAFILGTHSVLSHAAGSTLWPWVGIAVDWLHILAVGFWTGGLVALVGVLPIALKPYAGEQERQALLAVLRRFSRVAIVSLVVVITTGIYSTSNWITAPDEATTTFGLSLAVKLLMVALLIGVGALHHMALRPERYAALKRFAEQTGRFRNTLRLESALVMGTLIGVGWLSATPVPVPESALIELESPTQTQTLDGIAVTLSLSPGGPGVNTYDISAEDNGETVTAAEITLTVIDPQRDERGDPHLAEAVDGGLFVTAGDEIDREGEWWALIDLTRNGETQRFAYTWQITDEAAVIQTRPPEIQNILALMLVLIAVGWAIAPLVRRVAATLNMDAVSVTIAIGATVLTVIMLGVGFVVVQDAQQRSQALSNPPPEVVNTVLPDQASLDRGRSLYTEYCIQWQQNSRNFNELLDRLPRTGDDDLYAITANGWRDLPPCEGDLSETERWDVVNYFRTLGSTSSDTPGT